MCAHQKTVVAAVVTAFVLSACGTVSKDVSNAIESGHKRNNESFAAPVQIAPVSRVTEVRGKSMPVTAVTNMTANAWLKKIKVSLKVDNPTPLSAVVEKLASQGLNIVSDLPLSSYTYTGQINRTDADAALKSILGSVGLDYQSDDERKLVMIKPMSSKSWFLNIGKRRSNYSSDGSTQSTSSSGSSSGSDSSSGSSGGSNSTASSGSTGSSNSSNSGSSSGSGGSTGSSSGSSSGTSQASSTGVISVDDFWVSLSSELKTRLSVLMPREAAAVAVPAQTNSFGPTPGMQPPMPLPGSMQALQQPRAQMAGAGADSGSGGQYVSRQIGTFSLNPETGAITVQAPHWILSDLDIYINRVQEMYNSDITFSGELVLVTSKHSDSEGFDLSAFASWAGGKYMAVVANNALGGITVSLPTSGGAPTVTAGAQAVGGALVGLQYQGSNNAMNIFNAYLSEIGKVSVIQRPLITTTSGVPGVFSKKITDYYNTVSQQAASGGTGSAATATQNTLVPVDLGTELRINPRIDVSTGLIRAQLTLNQAIQSGTKNVSQTITFGGNASTVNTPIPLITRQSLSGEVLLRDGDLIVVGGQTEENLLADESGLPGQAGPMGGVFGTKTASRGTQTYYFALRVVVNKRK